MAFAPMRQTILGEMDDPTEPEGPVMDAAVRKEKRRLTRELTIRASALQMARADCSHPTDILVRADAYARFLQTGEIPKAEEGP